MYESRAERQRGSSNLSEAKTGQDLLFDALMTKGTAFTHAERRKFGLLGLLPTAEKTLDEQVEHSWAEFSTRREGLDQHIYLRELQDPNETLFYRLLTRTHPGDAADRLHADGRRGCQRFSEIYRGRAACS